MLAPGLPPGPDCPQSQPPFHLIRTWLSESNLGAQKDGWAGPGFLGGACSMACCACLREVAWVYEAASKTRQGCVQGYVPEVKMNLAGAPGLGRGHFSSGRLNRRPRWFQVATVDGSVGPGRPDPPTPRRSWQFGTLLVSESWLPLYAHICILWAFLGCHLHTTVKCANRECLA